MHVQIGKQFVWTPDGYIWIHIHHTFTQQDIRYNIRSTKLSRYREAMFIQMHLQPARSLGFDICHEVNICRFSNVLFFITFSPLD